MLRRITLQSLSQRPPQRLLTQLSTRLFSQPQRLFSYSAKGPSAPTAAWERTAVRVKNTESEKNNAYMELLRDTHDPSMHLKTIEDELKGSIGKALGKQGQKIKLYVTLMQKEYEQYKQIAKDDPSQASQRAQAFNEHRKSAIQARWELMVHRQAAGFIVNNHRYVMEHYPIAEALDVEDSHASEDGKQKQDEKQKKPTKQFGDQLDWWQRVGRWR